MPTRREFIKRSTATGVALAVSTQVGLPAAFAVPIAEGLSDPAIQPKFVEYAPNALDPAFIFEPLAKGRNAGKFHVAVKQGIHETGLRRNGTGRRLTTRIFGYGYDDDRGVTWPGRTLQVLSGEPTIVKWDNQLTRGGRPRRHLLPVDTSLHWAYSLEGYEDYSIEKNGVPIVTHLHGGHSEFQFDGNPEFFWSPDYEIVGPQWFKNGLDGIEKDFEYLNDQPAGTLWYHDHALGITRLNVYAGMAGFYIVRDDDDSGLTGNPLGLPAYPYELAYAIQDRMFTQQGELFYPAFPGDPFYDDFITGEGAVLPRDVFRKGGPTALAEFFGDHMVVNGKVWPKTDVEPRHYRLRLLNGCDSRFLVVRFRATDINATDLDGAGAPLAFNVIGSDQGLASGAIETETLVIEPGGRYDIVFDFRDLTGRRIVMENIGGDSPFGGAFGSDLSDEDLFPDRQTDRIMAFDVVLGLDRSIPDNFDSNEIDSYSGNSETVTRTRKVALFEGTDEFGRLQPLLGAFEENEWRAIAWHSPTTENPELDDTEVWEIYNFTGDAHPVHVHLVNFEVLGRKELSFEKGDEFQQVLQHNGEYGEAPSIENVQVGGPVSGLTGYVENAPKDLVTALPEQVTSIKMTFDKRGRYVWHCHILSHEDHEMMRVLEVG